MVFPLILNRLICKHHLVFVTNIVNICDTIAYNIDFNAKHKQ